MPSDLSELIKLDFFKQASMGTDQLRQRMAHALSQIIVTSEVEVLVQRRALIQQARQT